MIEGAYKTKQTVGTNGEQLLDLIDGVRVTEQLAVATGNGVTVEAYSENSSDYRVAFRNILSITYRARSLAAWYLHERQTDHIFCVRGLMRVVLFDDREGSATRGKVNVFNLSHMRPQLVVFPPNLWHGVQNLGGDDAVILNMFDKPYYRHEPDEWRLPPDTDKIPYRFVW